MAPNCRCFGERSAATTPCRRRLLGLFLLLIIFLLFVCAFAFDAVAATNKAGVEFLGENRRKLSVVELLSGLQCRVLRDGRGTLCPASGFGSHIQVHYEARSKHGAVVDSSKDRPTMKKSLFYSSGLGYETTWKIQWL